MGGGGDWIGKPRRDMKNAVGRGGRRGVRVKGTQGRARVPSGPSAFRLFPLSRRSWAGHRGVGSVGGRGRDRRGARGATPTRGRHATVLATNRGRRRDGRDGAAFHHQIGSGARSVATRPLHYGMKGERGKGPKRRGGWGTDRGRAGRRCEEGIWFVRRKVAAGSGKRIAEDIFFQKNGQVFGGMVPYYFRFGQFLGRRTVFKKGKRNRMWLTGITRAVLELWRKRGDGSWRGRGQGRAAGTPGPSTRGITSAAKAAHFLGNG